MNPNWRVFAVLAKDKYVASYAAMTRGAPVTYSEFRSLEKVDCPIKDITKSGKCLLGRFENLNLSFEAQNVWRRDICN